MSMNKRKQEMPKGTSTKAFGRLLKMILKDYPLLFLLVCVSVTVVALASVFNSFFVGKVLVDQFISPALTAPQGQAYTKLTVELTDQIFGLHFWQDIILLGCLFTAGIICSYLYNFYMAYISQGIQKKIRDELFAHMQDLPVSYFDLHTKGDIMSVYTNDVDSLREMLARSIPTVFSSLVTMIACLVFMLLTDFYLCLVVLFVGIFIFFVTKFFASHSGKHFVRQQRELGKTNGYIEEMIKGQRVVKVFNYEERNIDKFIVHNEELYQQSVKANRYANILMPVVNQLGNLQYALVALMGGLFIINHVTGYSFASLGGKAYEVGTIIAFLMYSKSFVTPMGQMANQLNTITMALAGAGRIFNLIDEPAEVDDGYVQLVFAREDENGNPVESKERTNKWAWKHPHADKTVTYTWLKGKININGVDFGYTKNKIVLHDITVYAEPGQKIAFVGPTGAGKTTITNLLNRFYDIADGKIRYDDININKIRKSDLRRSLGMVFQDTKLFSETVMENIRYGNPDASDEEVIAAAKLANADTFIQQLPNGYNTVLNGGGANLSQGQRQLLAIARAAVANPPVLILDEATSSIDSRTEALVSKGMDAIMEGRTVFVIAHRLSTIKNSDVIMVLDQGRIIERGNHDTLLAQKGKYYQLYTGNSVAK